MPVFLLSDTLDFPPPQRARRDGLLAVGGDLSQERLLLAYRMGIFPWYSEEDPIIWWSPDPRLVLYPDELKVSRSLRKVIRQERFRITLDTAFAQVIDACAQVRLERGEGTWIGPDMVRAYRRLHASGFAHSAEAWREGRLAGGLYGVSVGGCFFGESMFSRESNASKAAFVTLVDHLRTLGFDLIDCQVRTDHLIRFGAREIPRNRFLAQLDASIRRPTLRGRWSFEPCSGPSGSGRKVG